LALTDYTSTAQVASLGITFQPEPQLTLNLSGNFIRSQAEFDPVMMPAVGEEILEQIHQADYDYSGIHEYSNFEYEQLEATLGAVYKLNARTEIHGEATYFDLTDNEGYVYGVESGSVWIIRAGVRLFGR
jgi:hypothetical protein